MRTALAVLERRIAAGDVPEESLRWSRPLLEVVEANRPQIDAAIERLATAFPLATMAWTSLARTYSGEPARKLVNGVLGTAHREVAATAERDGGSNS
jgi:transcription termination factor NusB